VRSTSPQFHCLSSLSSQVWSGMISIPVRRYAYHSSVSVRTTVDPTDVPTCVVPRTLSITATELSQPLDLARGTLFRSSCAIQTSPTDCSNDRWRDTFFRKHEHGALWLLICGALEKHLLTYLLTYYNPRDPWPSSNLLEIIVERSSNMWHPFKIISANRSKVEI